MPYRMIKDTLRTSRNVSSLTDFQFRVWVHLITYVDDYGRGSADAELLKGILFPRRHGVTIKQIQDAIGALASKDMIRLYDFDGEPYFYFPKWGEHQRIRTKVSKFPEPPAECGELPQSAAECGELPPETRNQKPETGNRKPSNNPPVNAPAREDPELAKVMTFFLDRINQAPSPSCLDALKQYTAALSGDVVLHALEIAIDERKTGWSYINAILAQYQRDGVRDMDGLKRREKARAQARQQQTPGRRMSKTEELVSMGRNQTRPAGEIEKMLSDLDKI